MSDYVHHTFTWLSLADACPVCRRLNGRSFVDPPVYQQVLWDAVEGNLFDLERGIPLVHPNCRCQLTLSDIKIDTDTLFRELKETLIQLRDELRESAIV